MVLRRQASNNLAQEDALIVAKLVQLPSLTHMTKYHTCQLLCMHQDKENDHVLLNFTVFLLVETEEVKLYR